MNTLTALSVFIPRMIVATIVGGIIGLERELRHKVVGLKTNILICAGATLFATIGAAENGDSTRVTAQIVSGIGFLGAGAIFKAKDRVKGLTTAAFIWVVAALGVLIGQGGYAIAVILTVGMVMVVETLTYVEDHLLKKIDSEDKGG